MFIDVNMQFKDVLCYILSTENINFWAGIFYLTEQNKNKSSCFSNLWAIYLLSIPIYALNKWQIIWIKSGYDKKQKLHLSLMGINEDKRQIMTIFL